MNKKTYYNLLKEYQNLISQKQFNEYLCNRKKLGEVKETLLRKLRKSILYIACDIVDEQKGRIPKDSQREKKFQQLKSLYSKIEKEEPIMEVDYLETYHKPTFLFGLTLPQFIIVTILTMVITILYKLIAS